jgi:hypothetical protein
VRLLFQNDLFTYLLTTFNSNTQDIVASGDYFFSIDNGKFIIETQVTGTYRIEETEYVPFQVTDWGNSTQQPYVTVDLQDLALPLQIACRNTQQDECETAIEEFRTALNGTSVTIGDYTVGFRVSQPSDPTSAIKHAGYHWITYQVIIMLSAAKGLTYGNGILNTLQMKINGGTLRDVIVTDLVISTTAQQNPSTSTGFTKISNNDGTIQLDFTIFYDADIDVLASFLNWLWQDNDINQKYDIAVKYSGTITKTETFRITSLQQAIKYGTPIGFVVTMVTSS